MSQFDLVELARRLENLIRNGTIAEADYGAARVRVQYDTDENGQPVLTDWLPWHTHRAGSAIDWWPPEIGEQVTILSPSGNMALGVVMPSIYQAAHPAPSSDPNKRLVNFGDGSFIEYDRATHQFVVTVNGGNVLLNTTGNLDAVVGGNADVLAGGAANITANNITLDGTGGGGTRGAVQGDCVCAFTGAPHPQVSASVKASK